MAARRMRWLPALVEQAASLRDKSSPISLLMHLPYIQPKQPLPTDSPALGEALQAEQEQLISSEKSVRSHLPLKSDGLVPWLLPILSCFENVTYGHRFIGPEPQGHAVTEHVYLQAQAC